MIFPTGNKLNSILFIRCPQCHKGKFLERSPYNFSKFTKVKSHCDCCGLKYRLEPSFYFGSMYIAYAIAVIVMSLVALIIYMFTSEFSILSAFIIICVVMAILTPYINALSKIIWANMFFSYKNTSELGK